MLVRQPLGVLHSNNGTIIRYTWLPVKDAHMVSILPRLRQAKSDRLWFTYYQSSTILVCTDWFPSRMGVCLCRSKWLTICSIKVKSLSLWSETDFGSLNMGKMVTVCVYCTRSHVYSIIAPLLPHHEHLAITLIVTIYMK